MRYRLHYGPKRIDIAFPRKKVAVFVDGCFWHGCPEHFQKPSTNTGYWSRKICGNIARDRRENAELREQGWTVLRIWEHAVSGDDKSAVTMVKVALKSG